MRHYVIVKVLDMTQVDSVKTCDIPKVFVVCDQSDTAPVWGYVPGQQGLSIILEFSIEKAIDRCSTEMAYRFRNCSI